jgi:hypothetical protein
MSNLANVAAAGNARAVSHCAFSEQLVAVQLTKQLHGCDSARMEPVDLMEPPRA